MPPSVKDALNWITNPLGSLYGYLQTPDPIKTPDPDLDDLDLDDPEVQPPPQNPFALTPLNREVPTNEQLNAAINRPQPLNMTPGRTEQQLESEIKGKFRTYLGLYIKKSEIASIFGETPPLDLLTNIAQANYEKRFEAAIEKKLTDDNVSSLFKPLYRVAIAIQRFVINQGLSYFTSKIQKKLEGKIHLLKPEGAHELIDLISNLITGLNTFSEALTRAYTLCINEENEQTRLGKLTTTSLQERVREKLSQDTLLLANRKTLQEFSSDILNKVLSDLFYWSLSRILVKKFIDYFYPNPLSILTEQLPDANINNINLDYSINDLLLNNILKPLIETLQTVPTAHGEAPGAHEKAPTFADRSLENLQKTLQNTIVAIQLANSENTAAAHAILTKFNQNPLMLSLNPSNLCINPDWALKEGAREGAGLILKALQEVMGVRNQLLILASRGMDTAIDAFSTQNSASPTPDAQAILKEHLRQAENTFAQTLTEQIKKSAQFDLTKMQALVNEFREKAKAEGVAFIADITNQMTNPFGINRETLQTFEKRVLDLESQANKIIIENGITDILITNFLKEPTKELRIYLNNFGQQQDNLAAIKDFIIQINQNLNINPIFQNAVFTQLHYAKDGVIKLSFDRLFAFAKAPEKIHKIFDQILRFARQPTTLEYLGVHVPLAQYIPRKRA